MAEPVFTSDKDRLLGIERRQRLAAVLVLSAVQLPANAQLYCEHVLAVSKILPGVTVDEIPMNSRVECLHEARRLIEALLLECEP